MQLELAVRRGLVVVATSTVFAFNLAAVSAATDSADTKPTSSQSADTEGSGGATLEEITVTAQRRSEKLQEVPIAIEAFSDDVLEAAAITTIADVGMLTPGLEMGSEYGYAQPHLRGIGTTAVNPGIENPVAVYVDGVYYSSVAGTVSSLNNIAQVEIDKGPQGTLFGRNATGGLIQITTKDPSQDFTGKFGVGYGNYNTGTSDLYVSGGIAPTLAADVAAKVQIQGTGYGINYFNGLEINKNSDVSLRSKWILSPSDATEVRLIVDYEYTLFSAAIPPAPGTTPLGGPPYTGSPQGIDGYYQPYGRSRQDGVSLQFKEHFDNATFTSITAYREWNFRSEFSGSLVTNYDYALNIDITQPVWQASQEFQLAAPTDSRIKWITGVYLFADDPKYQPLSVYGGLLAPFTVDLTTTSQQTYSAAIYAQATTEVALHTDLTVGARETYEHRKFSGTNVLGTGVVASNIITTDEEQLSVEKPTWRLALDHKFTPDVMAFVSYNRGFKSGGFNDVLIPTTQYAPETLDAFEVGSKSDLLGQRVRVNASAFYYIYKNIQAVRYPVGLEEVFNAPKAELYGLDLDTEFVVTDQLQIRAGLEAMHSRYTDFPDASLSTPAPGGGTLYTTGSATGNHLALAPDFTGNVSISYSVPTGLGKLRYNVTYAYNSGWFAEPDNRLSESPYGLLNAEASLTSANSLWTTRVFGKNLTNKVYETQLSSQGNGDWVQYAPPRTYGVSVERRF